jgi:toxin ParE1/3/4
VTAPVWNIHLSDRAAADFHEILRWTAEQFGEMQARAYEATLASALEALGEGPGIAGVRAADDLKPGLRMLHAARKRRKARYIILFRAGALPNREIEVLRILHDSMDVKRHV